MSWSGKPLSKLVSLGTCIKMFTFSESLQKATKLTKVLAAANMPSMWPAQRQKLGTSSETGMEKCRWWKGSACQQAAAAWDICCEIFTQFLSFSMANTKSNLACTQFIQVVPLYCIASKFVEVLSHNDQQLLWLQVVLSANSFYR